MERISGERLRTRRDTAGRDSARADSARADTARRGPGMLERDRRRVGEPQPAAGWPRIAANGRDTAFALAALGSGSDYTAFLDHVGLASLNFGFGGDGDDGIYHSIHDTYDFYARFIDTTFAHGVALARLNGTALLRLADAPVLPFEFGSAARTYRRYVEEIEKGARAKPALRSLDLAAVRSAIDRLDAASDRHERALARLGGMSEREARRRWARLAAANRTLARAERALTHEQGLPGREWFRHLIYAPGFYTGYGVKTMPGIREAVEDRPDAAVAQREAARVAAAIERLAGEVEKAAAELEGALR
jgi:N-acetylated-alpha-linked acidic dipeptidase